MTTTFPILRVDNNAAGEPQVEVAEATPDELPAGEVRIRVDFASLNYKDALACQAHPGIVRSLPHVPGIDCAGEVIESDSADFQVGQQVLVTGCGLGEVQWGGFAGQVRVPAEWVVPMPEGLDARTAMIYGTAGFTAAQCVSSLVHHDISPDKGPIVVTGATGGVAVVAIAILSKLGYTVMAVTGKSDREELLKQLGAGEVVGREAVADDTNKPLLKSQWAGAVDTVGGPPLAMIVRSLQHRGCVAACGLVAGVDLSLTVHPFILRGVTLDGIDSAKCPRGPRMEIWRMLSTDWKVDPPSALVNEVSLNEVPTQVKAMLAGQHVGRTLVKLF